MAGMIQYSDAEQVEIKRIALATAELMQGWAAFKPQYTLLSAQIADQLSGSMKDDVLPLFDHFHSNSDEFRKWHAGTYKRQDDMWALAMRVIHSQLAKGRAELAALKASSKCVGSLQLTPGLVPPAYVTQTEGFHRQPGGYCNDRDSLDVRAGMLYDRCAQTCK